MTSAEAGRATDKFLAYFAEIQKLHESTLGTTLEMYKDTERGCLEGAFTSIFGLESSGLQFAADMVHRLVWGQCLGNGNHRTTVLFVAEFLDSCGVKFAQTQKAVEFEKSVNQWTGRSQALIRRRGEPGFAQARLEPRHREITNEWVAELLAGQSEVLTMIGPQRLMNFIS